MPRPEQHVEESTTGTNDSEKGPAAMNGWPKRATQANDEPAVNGLQCGSGSRTAVDSRAGDRLRSAHRQTCEVRLSAIAARDCVVLTRAPARPQNAIARPQAGARRRRLPWQQRRRAEK